MYMAVLMFNISSQVNEETDVKFSLIDALEQGYFSDLSIRSNDGKQVSIICMYFFYVSLQLHHTAIHRIGDCTFIMFACLLLILCISW